MDIKKAKKLIEKIQKLFKNLEKEPTEITSMERDLMLNYLRSLYDQFLEERLGVTETPSVEARFEDLQKQKEEEMRAFYQKQAQDSMLEIMKKRESEILAKARQEAEAQARKNLENRDRELKELARLEAERKANESAAIRAEIERKAREEAREKAETEALIAREKARIKEQARLQVEAEARRKAEDQAKAEAQKKTVELEIPQRPAKKASAGFNEDFDKIFATEETKELSQKLSERPVKDINLAISINDRMLYINELFQKNKKEFDQAIADLNKLHSMDEARAYMENHLIETFDWMSKKRIERAQNFVQLTRRRYL